MGYLSLVQLIVQLIICIKFILTQNGTSTTFRSVKQNATIVGVEPFYNQTTFSVTECYLACLQQIEKCWFVEVANVNEAWSCKLFEFYTENIEKYLKPKQGSVVSATPNKLPQDCVELNNLGLKDGVYSISNKKGSSIKVFCDMTTDGGGWIVMQKRFDGSIDFYRDWNNYRDGFGDVNGEHWVGNEFVYQYTKAYPTEMIMEGITFTGAKATSKMQNFTLSNEESKYIFEYDACEGLCGDWGNDKGQKFSTFDRDNDADSSKNCAIRYPGGWWFTACFRSILNGRYSAVPSVDTASGIHWYELTGHDQSLKETTMLIRRIQ